MRPFASTAVLSVLALAAVARAGAPWPQPAAGPSASGDPELLLTFDDGPHEEYTPQILDELKRRGLHAVFFWVGRRITGDRRGVDARRQIARRAVREGHLVGNHTIHHAQLCAGPRERAAFEIDENARMFRDLLGMPLRWFRAPYGAKCDRVRAMLAARGLTHFHWDMDPHEWEHHDLNLTLAYVERKLRALDGRGVLLMHDTKAVTARALPLILDWIDRENERRLRAGLRPIRIISYVDVAREQLAPGLAAWLRDAGADAAELAMRLAATIPGDTGRATAARAAGPR
ncbi:MAG: polysaccharide deacetylase family protein [Deltaproteobacteria bacterium]|nr:MAG: polysaccharide deacetylase family protein [Deltaproteobacteria bacterium]